MRDGSAENHFNHRPGKPPSICFVAQNAYGALALEDTGHIGGIETQQSLMSRWLADRGYPVSMITWDEGQPRETVIAGVRVYKMCGKNEGVRGLRFFHPRWTSLVRAMGEADADIYYYNCGDLGLGQIVLWAHRNGKKVFFSAANEADCDRDLPLLTNFRERILYRHGLRNADKIAAQTHNQKKMLREGFGVESTVIPMPSMGFDPDQNFEPQPPEAGKGRVLWVGRISSEKRLEWLLECARRCPNLSFDVVGSTNAPTPYSEKMIRMAESIPNVRLRGRVIHRRLGEFYRQADVLCCTSKHEGFPNTFLEAWSVGVPIVSSFDPDSVIASHGLGYTVDSVEQLVERLNEITSSQETWENFSRACKNYFLKNHTVQASMRLFETEFLKLSDKKPGPAGTRIHA